MTNQEINGRVAKLCGWFPVEDTESGLWHLSNADGRTIGYRSGLSEDHAWRVLTPNYAESLDACREFEDLIENSSDQEIRDYIINLEDASNARGSGWDWRSFRLARATPLQRCEAFLRLKGQWE